MSIKYRRIQYPNQPRIIIPIKRRRIWADTINRCIVWAGIIAFCMFAWYCVFLDGFDLYHLIGGK